MRLPIVNVASPINWSSSINQGLVSWWLNLPGGQWGGGTRWRDPCRRNDGTLTNGPTWSGAKGRPGGYGAIEFDNTNDEIVITNLVGAGTTNQATFCGWVMPRSVGAFDGILVGAGNQGLSLSNAAGSPVTCNWNDTSGEYTRDTGLTLTLNTWSWVAGVVNGALMTVYRWSGGVWGSHSWAITNSSKNLDQTYKIGRDRTFAGRWWDGWMDDLRLYNVARSDGQIVAMLQDSLAGYPSTINWIAPRRYAPAQAAAVTRLSRLSLLGVG